ncbi:MAG: hypothetical protein ACRCZO_05500, partial [Cetobacterium sp.]
MKTLIWYFGYKIYFIISLTGQKVQPMLVLPLVMLYSFIISILALTCEMLTKQEMILDQQQSIIRILNSKELQDTHYKTEDGLLPVKDPQGLKTLEQKLQTSDFKEKTEVF